MRDVESDVSTIHLVQAATAGDAIAEGQLIERYQSRLIRLAASQLPAEMRIRIDPEDIVQSACRVFVQRMRDGEIEVAKSGDLWIRLMAITLNKIRSSVRKHQRAKRSVHVESEGADLELVSRDPTPEEACLLVETVEGLLASFPKSVQRRVIILRLQGFTTGK